MVIRAFCIIFVNQLLIMKYILLVVFIMSTQLSWTQKKPLLVVGVVLDQMRPDYLVRFAAHMGDKGFKRLLKEGNECRQAYINYLPSYTAPGHTCIYTGTVPAIHGIASNDWIDRVTGQWVYCTADPAVKNVGGTVKAGKMSPKNLWSNTITDELRLANNFKSKVIAISVKDRASILPGGHTANAAYWMDDSLGEFMSSTYYMNALPAWVFTFNQQALAKQYMQKNWNTKFTIDQYVQSTADNNNYEGKFSGENTTSFPHMTENLKLSDIKKTPYGNQILTEFAKAAIVNEALGQDDITDFLTISYSSTDYIGHMFGPNSVEIEDTYYRMDEEIETLLDFLDDKVGKGNYTLFLTADHGVAHNPQFLIDNKIPGGYLFEKEVKSALNNYLTQQFKVDSLISDIAENYIWLNLPEIYAHQIDEAQLLRIIQQWLLQREDVQFVLNMHNPSTIFIPDQIKHMAVNGYVKNRCGDLLLLLKPGYIDAYAKTGTTHGTWNPYDTHIPLIWYGWGIEKGITHQKVYMTDIAATLAALLNIQIPNGCIGQPIHEILKN